MEEQKVQPNNGHGKEYANYIKIIDGSGDDGSGVCPDCECTGLAGGQYAAERFDDFIEQMKREYEEMYGAFK